MSTFSLSGGGALAAIDVKQAHASTATALGSVVLGSGLMGPQPFASSDGGAIAVGAGNPHGFSLSGGGASTGAGRHEGLRALTSTGGGAITIAVVVPTAAGGALALSGGGTLAFLSAVRFLLPVTTWSLELPGLSLGAAPTPTPAGLTLNLTSSTTVALSPGSLIAYVTNGTPEQECDFTIVSGGTSTPALSTTFDDAGLVGGISVPVSVSAEGTYTLVATDLITSLTASVTFTVAAVAVAATIGAPVTTPPPAVQPGTGVRKWVFQDPASSDVYHFAINPDKMTSPFAPKKITFQATTAIDGAQLAFEGMAEPMQWQFSGILFDEAQYDAFAYWFHKRNRIWITDHYGRAWLSYLINYDPIPHRDTSHPWCHDWTMTALIFQGPVTPS